jgi:hypothetical protein
VGGALLGEFFEFESKTRIRKLEMTESEGGGWKGKKKQREGKT